VGFHCSAKAFTVGEDGLTQCEPSFHAIPFVNTFISFTILVLRIWFANTYVQKELKMTAVVNFNNYTGSLVILKYIHIVSFHHGL